MVYLVRMSSKEPAIGSLRARTGENLIVDSGLRWTGRKGRLSKVDHLVDV